MKLWETPGQPIDLAWNQHISAFWSIAWPAFLATIVVVIMSVPFIHDLPRVAKYLSYYVIYWSFQALFIRRLVKKNYASFRVYVLRDEGTRSRKMSLPEIVRVWLWIVPPQMPLLLLIQLMLFVGLSSELLSSLGLLPNSINWLILGPFGVKLALRAKYPRFKLQGFALL